MTPNPETSSRVGETPETDGLASQPLPKCDGDMTVHDWVTLLDEWSTLSGDLERRLRAALAELERVTKLLKGGDEPCERTANAPASPTGDTQGALSTEEPALVGSAAAKSDPSCAACTTLRAELERAREENQKLTWWREAHLRIHDASDGFFREARATIAHLLDDPATGIAGICRNIIRIDEDRDRLRSELAASQAREKGLREILTSVEEWWLREGMHESSGAPNCIFRVRAALAAGSEAQSDLQK